MYSWKSLHLAKGFKIYRSPPFLYNILEYSVSKCNYFFDFKIKRVIEKKFNPIKLKKKSNPVIVESLYRSPP